MVTYLWHHKLNEIFVTDKNKLKNRFQCVKILKICKIVELMKRDALIFNQKPIYSTKEIKVDLYFDYIFIYIPYLQKHR